MRALYNILRVIFGVKSCKKRFFIFVVVKYFPERVMAAIFVACGDSLRGSAGQRSMRESNRCDGVQCAHQFFRKRSPTPRRTYTQLFSLLLSLSSIFTRTRFFSKNLCCCCYFGHCCRGFWPFSCSDRGCSSFLATVVVVAKLLRFNRYW